MGLCRSQRAIISTIVGIILLLLVALLISRKGVYLINFITELAVGLTLLAIGVFYYGFKPYIDRWFSRGRESENEFSFPSEEKLAKVITGLETIEKRREKLENSLRTHYHQLVEEVYEKWFDRPSLSIDIGDGTEYSISLAKIIFVDGNITIKELEEPLHQNKRIIEEAIDHLKCYPEVWSFWSDAKKQVKQNLTVVEKLWRDLIRTLTERLSTCCPQLVGWHGRGAIPNDYYSLRITFSWLWLCVQNNRVLNEIVITQNDNYFLVNDFAQSLNKTTMEAFTKIFKELATDSAVQKKMKTITAQKTIIEDNIEKFQESLKLLTDDVKRKDERLEGNCPTCKPWLEELTTLEK